ncbi:MAG: hypothetical protein K0Q66_1584 [Chitinophagaceae bacterium]|jgi:hypothetical protein|nr:hypothetical protein [Chitinophagaceae bacterium]
MKIVSRRTLLLLFTLVLLAPLASFRPHEKGANATKEFDLCNGVAFIAESFYDAEYDSVKGKVHPEYMDEFESLVKIKGFNQQRVFEEDDEIYFEARYTKPFKSAADINAQLKKLAEELEGCLIIKPEYLEVDAYVIYTFDFGEGVEIELSSNHYKTDKRYINLDITQVR